jgi:spore maturation protein SpmB
MAKILVPISFVTSLLQWSGLLGHMDGLLRPVMKLLSLPAVAALPLLIGMLTGIYGGIAAMCVLPFSREQMTLMAIFLLISHNMVQEGAVQGHSGMHPVKATILRLAAATITVVVVARFLDTSSAFTAPAEALVTTSQPLLAALRDWGATTLHLIVKIFLIIMSLLTVLENLKAMGWIDHVVGFFSPFLLILGLTKKVGILWVTAVIFGLAYGSAVIVEEAKRGDISKEELQELHLSIGINHSMVEDPTLFLALGLSAFWLWVPRLIMAIVAVHLLRIWRISFARLRARHTPKTML